MLCSLIQTSEFGRLDSTLKSVCSTVWSFHAGFFFFTISGKNPLHVGACLFESKEHTYLWSWQKPPENRFSSLFLINLWTKTRGSDILQRRLRKIYNPSGRSLSSISHEDLTLLSCEAGNRVLFFLQQPWPQKACFLCGAVGMWQEKTWCGHWKQSRSWQVEARHNEGIVAVCPQLQMF